MKEKNAEQKNANQTTFQCQNNFKFNYQRPQNQEECCMQHFLYFEKAALRADA